MQQITRVSAIIRALGLGAFAVSSQLAFSTQAKSGGINIDVADAQYQYFQYQSLLLTNNSGSSATLLAPDLSAALDQVEYCTGSCVPPAAALPSCGLTIANGDSCLVWFKSTQDDNEPLATITGDVTVRVQVGGTIYSRDFSLAQQTALYVTGDFTCAGGTDLSCSTGVAASAIAKWDGTNWYNLGAGLNGGRGRDFALYGGNLYVIGEFESAGTLASGASNLIAQWNGADWLSVPGGALNASSGGGNGYALLVSATNGMLYAGGTFQSAGSISANNIAAFDINSGQWSSLASLAQATYGFNGVNTTVYSLAQIGSDLYLGGSFLKSNGGTAAKGQVAMSKIGVWSGGAWTALNPGLSANVHAFLTEGTQLYTGGDFLTTSTSSIALNHIGAWDGTSWSSLSSGLGSSSSQTLYALHRFSNDNLLYAGGSFAGYYYLASWDGSSWSSVNSAIDGTVRTIVERNNQLYIGGQFSAYNYLLSYDGSTWATVGNGLNNRVYNSWIGTSLQFVS